MWIESDSDNRVNALEDSSRLKKRLKINDLTESERGIQGG